MLLPIGLCLAMIGAISFQPVYSVHLIKSQFRPAVLKTAPDNRVYGRIGKFILSDGRVITMFLMAPKGSTSSAVKTYPPVVDEAKSEGNVYFSSRDTYQKVDDILKLINLSGVQSDILADANRYLHNFKGNVLFLVSQIGDFSKISDCFGRNVIASADQARDALVASYDSCNGSGSCKVNALTEYSNQLDQLHDGIYNCIGVRL